MTQNSVYERDLLYPTENFIEPGCIQVKMFSPNKAGKVPVVIIPKTTHSAVENIEAILKVMQIDILDRINLDIKKNVEIYISVNEAIASLAKGKQYLKVSIKGYENEYTPVDEVE